jgi:hypothetical protein
MRISPRAHALHVRTFNVEHNLLSPLFSCVVLLEFIRAFIHFFRQTGDEQETQRQTQAV